MSSWFPNRLDAFVGNFVQRFAQLLTAEYQVSVIHTMGDAACSRIEKVIDESEGVFTVRIYHPISKNKFMHWYWQRKALSIALDEVEEVDLLFAHVILNRGLQFVRAKRYYHCPLIVMEHASYYRKEISQKFSRLQRSIIKRTSLHINELLACSAFLQEDMKAIFPTTKSTVLPNFVDTELFFSNDFKSDNYRRFIHVSTLDESVKDPETLLNGFALAVKAGNPDVQLTVISDQPSEKWQEMAALLGIANNVTFVGPMNWNEIAEQMRGHDAFLLTSSYETFSIVLAEAWLTGLPTITTPVGIGKDLDPSLGLQIPIGNPQALADALQQLMNKNVQFDTSVIREKGLEYSEDKVIAQLKAIFERHLVDHE
jgi:glycosyltransferase involved in cell wall biosynthesis